MTRSQARARREAGRWRPLGEEGASLVEFAASLLLLLLLLAGAVDVGRALNSYIIIMNACREGARYASHFPHLASGILEATKQEAVLAGVELEDENIIIIPEPPPGALPDDPAVAQPGQSIEVRVEFDESMLMGSMLGFGSITLRARAEMVVFGQDS